MSLTKVSYSMINGTPVNVLDFGAVGDGVTDDTAAIQAAIDYCLDVGTEPSVPKQLVIPSKCKITSSLLIDRPVDTTSAEFIIQCINDGSLYTEENNLFFFSSSLTPTPNVTYGTSPVSECVTFVNVNFQSLNSSQNCKAVDGDTLFRIKFESCYFWKTRAVFSNSYLQTYDFNMCQARGWSGYFVEATGLFDFHVNLCQFEEAITSVGYGFGANEWGVVGGSFTNNLYEGTSGFFISSKGSKGLTVSGNYFEYNTGLTLDLSLGNHFGASFTGNSIETYPPNKTDTNFYEVIIGVSSGFFGAGNTCDSRLYNSTNYDSNITIGAGDYAALDLYKGIVLTVLGNLGVAVGDNLLNSDGLNVGNGGVYYRTGSSVVQVWNNNPSTGVQLAASGTSWSTYSDERIKENLVPIEDAVNKVSTLRAVIGNLKDDEDKISRSFLIAQDIEQVLPEAVDYSDPEKLGLRYTDVIPLLVAAIKELKTEIDTLKGAK